MPSLEKPTSPTKRPGLSLNLNAGYTPSKAQSTSAPQSPDLTDIGTGKAITAATGRALKAQTTPRETFFDSISPVNKNGQDDLQRPRNDQDPHDLAISPSQVTNDALVDIMLLSLDQLSSGQSGCITPVSKTADQDQLYSAFGDGFNYSKGATSRSRIPPNHLYSYSTELEDIDRDLPMMISGRGPSTPTSNNDQIGVFKANGSPRALNGANNAGATRPLQSQARALHSRGGKGSKGSSANSLDMGYTQAAMSRRWQHNVGSRSASFDYGHDRQAIVSIPDDYDVAPEPTIAAGPRRQRPPSRDATFLPEVPPIPITIERKISTRSSKSAYKGRPDSHNAHSIKHNSRGSREIPLIPAVKEQPAPAPLIGYGKTKENQNPNSTPPAKEKQGFFRRVFGGSSKHYNVGSAPEQSPSRQNSAGSMEAGVESPTSRQNHIAGLGKFNNGASAREAPPIPKEPTHVLTKKPSSFFRRRKKSVSEAQPAPAPEKPAAVDPSRNDRDDQSKNGLSPASSLRAVMNPYLSSPVKPKEPPALPRFNSLPPAKPMEPPTLPRFNSLPVNFDDIKSNTMQASYLPLNTDDITTDPPMINSIPQNTDDSRGFSAGYIADKSATIRTVRPGSREGVVSSVLPSGSGLPKSRQVIGEVTSRIPSGAILPLRDDRTFLQNSKVVEQVVQTRPSSSLNPGAIATSRLSPTIQSAIAKDMALVAEYERVYSKRTPITTKSLAPSLATVATTPSSNTDSLKASKAPMEAAMKDSEWVVVSASKPQEKEARVRLEPSDSDENLIVSSNVPADAVSEHLASASALSLPQSSAERPQTPELLVPIHQTFPTVVVLPADADEVEDEFDYAAEIEEEVRASSRLMFHDDADNMLEAEPTTEDHETAQKIYDGDETFVPKFKTAAWLGEESLERHRILVAYLELFDLANMNILAALRILCGRLTLKAETQQVDRILEAFSQRWCQCNPNHGFKMADVVHTICYSLLLLNTDLHLADIESKMTRSQFVKNTIPTIMRVIADSAIGGYETNRPSILPGRSHNLEVDSVRPESRLSVDRATTRSSNDHERTGWRSSFLQVNRTGSDLLSPTPLNFNTTSDDCGPLVKAPFQGTLRTWEVQVEIVLKDFYNSIRNDRLPLFGAELDKLPSQNASQSGLSVLTSGMLRRTPSVISKTPSDAHSFNRGRSIETMRVSNGKWASKNRSRGRVYPNSTMASSRTSFDDQSSMWSPSVASSTWSKYSLGKTQASMSSDSISSNWPQGNYQQSIGFANALSQAIIREETVGCGSSNDGEELRAAPLLEDESLELCGAPWAKEGIVKHKHHLEASEKRAKDRNWNEVFAVVEKGYMTLFSFSSKSMRNKTKGKAIGAVVGGGNWQENAENLGSFLLRQTIASALPPPGYSKARPHVFALSLPTGAVHLFQVGTPEIVREFVSTANYWSARLSNHPLVGGISNIEYGWSDAIVNNVLVAAINDSARPSTSGPRQSLHDSIRSSLEHSGGRPRLPGDRILISDWMPPTQSMRSSNLMEQDQLRTLVQYVKGIEEELQKHNELRSSMLLAFSPRQMNSGKALANWEKKSAYLLREIVKFRTYIDCLQAAELQKHKIYLERAPTDVNRVGDETLKP